jgi:hypothetical protein
MIVGLAGYARAGKDTVAGILHDAGFRQIAFADALKKVLYDMDPYLAHVVDIHGWEGAKQAPTGVREALQRLGVACRDHIGRDVWVDAVFHQIEDAYDHAGPTRWVISDVRFPNEFAAVRAHAGHMWRITRPVTGPVNGHISEVAIDGERYDQIIDNTGTLADLRRDVLDLIEVLSVPS